MKNKWLIWIIILLLLMNISAVITMLYHRKQENRTMEISLNSVTKEQAPSMQYSGRWFRDELRLTRVQMKEFSGFNPVFRQRVRNINMELSEKRRKLLDELAQPNSDTVLLNDLSDSIGMLHSELKKVTYAYYLEFKRMCTPDQQQKLREIFSRMFEGEIPAVGPGRGMQGGRGSGMRWRSN